MLSSTRWRVDFAITSADDVSELAPQTIVQEEGTTALTVLRPEGRGWSVDAVVAVELHALDEEEAILWATEFFAENCADAGVGEHACGWLIGVMLPAASSGIRAAQVLDEAIELERQHPEAAVLMVHSACEMVMRDTIASLLRARLGANRAVAALRAWRPGLSDRRSRNALHALLDIDVTTTTWWPAFQAHVARRNAIAHEGLEVTEALAAESRRAVAACVVWFDDPAMRHSGRLHA